MPPEAQRRLAKEMSPTSGATRVSGVILAGGLSRRMGGGDKGLTDLAGKPVLAHVVERFAPQVARLALNVNGDPSRFLAFGLPVVSDDGDGYQGPLAGVLAGMRWCAETDPGSALIATAPCDSPFVPTNLVERLMAASLTRPGAVVVAAVGGRAHPVAALWPTALEDAVAGSLERGERAVLAFAIRHHSIMVEFPLTSLGEREIDPFFNINVPADLALARDLLAAEARRR